MLAPRFADCACQIALAEKPRHPIASGQDDIGCNAIEHDLDAVRLRQPIDRRNQHHLAIERFETLIGQAIDFGIHARLIIAPHQVRFELFVVDRALDGGGFDACDRIGMNCGKSWQRPSALAS